MTQNEIIIKHLKAGKTLTPLQALSLCGTLRLAARINDLRSEGYDIRTDMIEAGGARVARYALVR